MTNSPDEWKNNISCGKVLRVVIRDDSPMMHCGDPPRYRTVSVILTDEQLAALSLRPVYKNKHGMMYESISNVLIEEQ